MSRPTISDVASSAQVSKATVSRVLSGNIEYMRAETRQRVLAAIQELDYRPSSVARSLTSKRSLTAGILVSDIGNPFYPEVIRGVEDVAMNNGYNIFLCNTNYELARGMTHIRSLVDQQVDGALIMSSTMSDDWLLELARQNIPTVILDWAVNRDIDGALGVIEVDFESGITEAIGHLVALGHQRLAHVCGPLGLRTSRLRHDAFQKATETLNIPPEQITLIEGNLRTDSGEHALQQLLALPDQPTAIFAANDLMALGIVRAARTYGLQVPTDLSVIGLDDIWLVRDMEPPLTTVALPRYEIGQLAMNMLFELLTRERGAEEGNLSRQVETHLVIRQSTTSLSTT